MARKRQTERPARSAGQPVDRTGQRKVTMWLDVELAKRLRHAAVEDEREIGQVAASGIELALAGRYWTDRKRPAGGTVRPAIAAGTLGRDEGPGTRGEEDRAGPELPAAEAG